jgi:signal transduction histidine kinase
MPPAPRPPLVKRLPPGAWTALPWAAATAVSILAWDAAGGYSIAIAPGVGLPGGSGHELHLPGGPDPLFLIPAAVLTLAGSAALRRIPLGALGLLLAGSVTGALGFRSAPIGFWPFLPVDVALYFIAAGRPRRTSVAALVLTLATMACYVAARLLTGDGLGTLLGVMQVVPGPPRDNFSMEFAVTLTGVVAWLIGTSSRQGREYARSLGAQAATAERLQISRELHDSVAHSIGIIAILAGAAGRVIETQPAAAREALGSIEMTSRDTLTGLQRMLTALRHAEPGADRDAVPLAPAPGLTDLGRLAAQAAGAGVRVDVTWRGERRPLPPEIDLSAFRIIQEAVTNVVRHSGTHACGVDVGFEADELSIEIVDSGRGLAHLGAGDGGFGLIGMRERVAMLSGQFSAGPRPEGGFRVAARLPA